MLKAARGNMSSWPVEQKPVEKTCSRRHVSCAESGHKKSFELMNSAWLLALRFWFFILATTMGFSKPLTPK